MPRPVKDPVLGKMKWSKEHKSWDFEVSLDDNQSIEAWIYPRTSSVFPDKLWREIIVAQVRFVQENEEKIRIEVARVAIEWWLEEAQCTVDDLHPDGETPEEFARWIPLTRMTFHPDGTARLDFQGSHVMQYEEHSAEIDMNLRFWGEIESHSKPEEEP